MMKISALLLSVWYCLSIIGFDVHTCNGSGDSFVTASFTTIDCETIHPGHHHGCDGEGCTGHHHSAGSHEGCCCNSEGEVHLHPSDCCKDDYQVILLTGIRSNEQQGNDLECHCDHCPYPVSSAYEPAVRYSDNIRQGFRPRPDSGSGVPDVQAFFGIWRI